MMKESEVRSRRQPIYLKTAACGHFGRPEFPWERVDMIEELLAKAKKL